MKKLKNLTAAEELKLSTLKHTRDIDKLSAEMDVFFSEMRQELKDLRSNAG